MPTIGDFKVVMDKAATLERGGTNFVRVDFNLPTNTATSQRAVLMYRVEVEEADDLKYELNLNKENILTLTHDERRFGTIHEVIAANVLHNGENQFMAVATKGEGKLKISDVVILFQANV